MEITPETLREIAEFEPFENLFVAYSKELYRATLLVPQISKRRLYDAHIAWKDDLSRVQKHERNLDDELDHFKQSGHLAYWFRRMSSIVEYTDQIEAVEGGEVVYQDEQRARDLILSYGSEFVAFDFGFRICLFYESTRTDQKEEKALMLPSNYILDVVHMLKFKNVSPHSLFLI